jgi:hypothetical protein
MDPERLEQLLDSYGADERRWPAELRATMLEALDTNPGARQQRQAARDLDLLLDSYQPAVADLSLRILDAMPQTPFERLLAWLLPEAPGMWWRPALAGALPFVMGLAIGFSDPYALDPTGAGNDGWEAQERALMTPATMGLWYE